MRRKVTNRNIVSPDIMHDSVTLEKFINCLMQSGKKNTARKIVYDAFDIIKEKDAVHIDEIFLKSNLSSSSVAAAILNLELQNALISLPGKMYKIA